MITELTKVERKVLFRDFTKWYNTLPEKHRVNCGLLFDLKSKRDGTKFLMDFINRSSEVVKPNLEINYGAANDFSFKYIPFLEERKELLNDEVLDSVLVLISSFFSKFMPQTFEVALLLRKVTEHTFLFVTNDKKILFDYLRLVAARSFFNNVLLRQVLYKNEILYWEKLYQQSSGKISFLSIENDLYDFYQAGEDETGERDPATNEIVENEFSPMLTDKKGYVGYVRYDHVAKNHLFNRFEKALYDSGLINNMYQFDKKGVKKHLAILCKYTVLSSYFKPASIERPNGFKSVDFRKFFEYRYQVNFKDEFNRATQQDFEKLCSKIPYNLRL